MKQNDHPKWNTKSIGFCSHPSLRNASRFWSTSTFFSFVVWQTMSTTFGESFSRFEQSAVWNMHLTSRTSVSSVEILAPKQWTWTLSCATSVETAKTEHSNHPELSTAVVFSARMELQTIGEWTVWTPDSIVSSPSGLGNTRDRAWISEKYPWQPR